MKKRLTVAVLAMALLIASAVGTSADDKKKEIKLHIRSEIERGEAPLPVTFVVEIDAPEELDKYLYESSYQWKIEGQFRLTNHITGGNPVEDPTMRSNPASMGTQLLYSNRHLVAKERKRAPRKQYDGEMDVPRTIQFTHEFKRPGKYYIIFELRNGRYKSNMLKIDVRGDTSFDPIRDRY